MQITNIRIALPNQVMERGSIHFKDGLITRITEEDMGGSSSDSLDFAGATLFPGFIDVHLHGAAGIDTMAASVGELRDVSSFLATKGVTAWMPTLVPAGVEVYLKTIETIDRAMQDAQTGSAPILGAHYEGPFVNSAQCGALHREHFRTFRDDSDVEDLPVLQTPGSRMMTTLAPEVEGVIELIKKLRQRGWIVSIGHTRASMEVLDQALAAGARHMTHFMNAMTPLHHREPGPVGWGLWHDDVTCDIIADGIHLAPLTLQLLTKMKGPRALCLISDSIAAAGKGDGEYQIWGETIKVKNGRTSNAAGSIAGSVITMLDAVAMMRSLGVSDVDIAQMASTNPARLLGIDAECGSIEEGKRADLVAVDADGRVRLTVIGGEIAYKDS